MDTAEAQKLAESLMAEHGLDGWTFEWSRAKQEFGACYPFKKTIRLSRPMVELNDAEKVRDTILHEVAHALCPPDEAHGPAWQAKAREIGCSAHTTCDDPDMVAPAPKFAARCLSCGSTTFAHRRTDVSCRECSPGGYDPVFKLDWFEYTGPYPPLEVVNTSNFSAHEAASYVRARWAAGQEATLAAYAAMLDVGEMLLKVKAYWRTKVILKEWWGLYDIPFSMRWGNTLMRASQHRDRMLQELEAQMAEGAPNFKAALQLAEGKAPPTGTQVPEPEAEADVEGGELVLVEPEPSPVAEWVATLKKLAAEIAGTTVTYDEGAELADAIVDVQFAVKEAAKDAIAANNKRRRSAAAKEAHARKQSTS